MKTIKTKKLFMTSCKDCPFVVIKPTPRAGFAVDYTCSAAGGKTIKGYVEWASEGPQLGEFPKFCPLDDGKKVKVDE